MDKEARSVEVYAAIERIMNQAGPYDHRQALSSIKIMNKRELVKTVSEAIQGIVLQNTIRLILNKRIEAMNRTLNEGGTVELSGFGTICVKTYWPRRFYSSQHKKFVLSKGKKRIVFISSRLASYYERK